MKLFGRSASREHGGAPARAEGGLPALLLRQAPSSKQRIAGAAPAHDAGRYSEAQSIFDALSSKVIGGVHPVRLLRMSWVLKQGGTVLSRRQQLQEEAFISAEELRSVWKAGGRGGVDKVLPVVVLSGCPIATEHPDPTGAQLDLVIKTLRREQKRYQKAAGDFRGFSEMGVFWAWGSVLQGDLGSFAAERAFALQGGRSREDAEAAGRREFRSHSEQAAFDFALHQTMDLWYAHQGTTVYLLTHQDSEQGWPTYERCSTGLFKKAHRVEAKWDAVLDLGTGTATAAVRRWPVGPDDFDEIIRSCAFERAEERDAARGLYRKMSEHRLGGTSELDFAEMRPPADEDAGGLGRCLSLCGSLRKLDLRRVDVSPSSFRSMCESLSEEALPKLEELWLGGIAADEDDAQGSCEGGQQQPSDSARDRGGLVYKRAPDGTIALRRRGVSDAGLAALAAALVRGAMPALRLLDLRDSSIGDDGVSALARAASTKSKSGVGLVLSRLESLDLDENEFGRIGAGHLMDAMTQEDALPSLASFPQSVLQKVNQRVLFRSLEFLKSRFRDEFPKAFVRDKRVISVGDEEAREMAGAASRGVFDEFRRLPVFFRIGDHGLQALAEAAQSGAFAQLTHLDLSWCKQISNVGVQALAHAGAAGSLPDLTSLDMGGCERIGDPGVRALAEAAAEGAFPKLAHLDLRVCGQFTRGAVDDLTAAFAGRRDPPKLLIGSAPAAVGDRSVREATVPRADPPTPRSPGQAPRQNRFGEPAPRLPGAPAPRTPATPPDEAHDLPNPKTPEVPGSPLVADVWGLLGVPRLGSSKISKISL